MPESRGHVDEDYEGHRPGVVPASQPIAARDAHDTARLEEARLPDFTPPPRWLDEGFLPMGGPGLEPGTSCL